MRRDDAGFPFQKDRGVRRVIGAGVGRRIEIHFLVVFRRLKAGYESRTGRELDFIMCLHGMLYESDDNMVHTFVVAWSGQRDLRAVGESMRWFRIRIILVDTGARKTSSPGFLGFSSRRLSPF